MDCYLFSLLLMLGAGLTARAGPWPPSPLVTDCDIMPYIARDATFAVPNSPVVCTSGASDNYCDTITCSVATNLDQLEFELLPCWQHPALWFKVRDINGKQTYQDIFDSSRVVKPAIGGSSVPLNFTIIQHSGLTLGFKLVGTIETDSGSTENVTFVRYRDIPINLTACFPDPTYPTDCEFLKIVEQYVLTYYANMTNSLEMTPECSLPNSKSCKSGVECFWTNGKWTAVLHLFYCSKPAIIVAYSDKQKTSFNMTFTKSKLIKVKRQFELNVTLEEIDSKTVGVAVDMTDQSSKTHTLIPYAAIPTVCDTPDDESSVEVKKRQLPPPPQPSNNTTISRPSDKPLATTCEYMELIAQTATGVANLSCSVVSANCTLINCTLPTAEGNNILQLNFTPCLQGRVEPVLGIKVYDRSNLLDFNKLFYRSGHISSIRIGNQSVPLNVTIRHHPSDTSMGIKIVAGMSDDVDSDNSSESALFSVPYREIPINVSSCSPHPPRITPTCQAMTNIAQYVVVLLGNVTHSPVETPDCDPVKPGCSSISCKLPNNGGQYRFNILQCAKPGPQFKTSINVSYGDKRVICSHTSLGSETIECDSTTNARLMFDYNYTTNSVELGLFLSVSDVFYDLPMIPRIQVPLPTVKSCSSVTTEPSVPTTHHPSVHILTLIEIIVPVTATLLVVILLMACVIIVLCLRQRLLTRGRGSVLHFEPMSLTYDGSDDDDDDDEMENYS